MLVSRGSLVRASAHRRHENVQKIQFFKSSRLFLSNIVTGVEQQTWSSEELSETFIGTGGSWHFNCTFQYTNITGARVSPWWGSEASHNSVFQYHSEASYIRGFPLLLWGIIH